MVYFCTLFDKHYMIRGLAMYESLKKIQIDFHIYIFAFCEDSYKALIDMKLENTTVISLKEFEDEELLKVKNGRTIAEYCWTCTPSVIKYVLEKYQVPYCIYLDSDLYFFSSPEDIINELVRKYSIGITPHRFSEQYKKYEINGIYNVQFMYFKNDKNGNEALQWWRERCNEWCYARVEDGKFGDQKYLDDWPNRFNSVKVIDDENIGVAPWNFHNFTYFIKNDKVFQKSKQDSIEKPVIFYHFHNLKIYKNGYIYIWGYYFTNDLINCCYEKYKNEFLNVLIKYEKYLNTIQSGIIQDDLESVILYETYQSKIKNVCSTNNIIVYNDSLFYKRIKSIKSSLFFNYIINYIKKIVKKILRIFGLWRKS